GPADPREPGPEAPAARAGRGASGGVGPHVAGVPALSRRAGAALRGDRLKAFRGTLVDFTGDPRADRGALRHIEDGLLLLDQGRVVSAAPYQERPGVEIVDYRGKLLMPGFVDAHVHSAQTDVIASPSDSLLDWLDRYTFPAEARFADAAYAREASDYFI